MTFASLRISPVDDARMRSTSDRLEGSPRRLGPVLVVVVVALPVPVPVEA